jgi:ubiquitin carboxyl-terminal hydrolase L5
MARLVHRRVRACICPANLAAVSLLITQAIFNQLLWDIGVSAAQVHEIYSLDLESFHNIKYQPLSVDHSERYRPVHGLIFLFNWKKDANDEEVEMSCPENIWFANQVIDNACASLALLNIVLNSSQLDIGEHLTQFRQFTADLSPSVLVPKWFVMTIDGW